MICQIEGCSKEAVAHGWCPMHYRRWKRYGDPEKVSQVQHHGLSLRERLLQRVNLTPECWEWTGSLNRQGYGQMRVVDSPRLAHRLSWEAFKGQIPEGAFVLHRCDNPKCINPAHLFLGDNAENMADKMRKKRHRFGVSRGSKHGCAVLTEEQVREIRASVGPSHLIGQRYGVSGRTIRQIRTRETWAHLS